MEAITAFGLMLLLILSGGLGTFVQKRLKEHHRSHDSFEAVRLITTMLVTLSALILGLLVTSVKADFDSHDDLYRQYGVALIRLDTRLREFGVEASPIRKNLREFTAMVIRQAWPDEKAPGGIYPIHYDILFPGSHESRQNSLAIRAVDEAILTLKPASAYQQNIYPIICAYLNDIETIRWTLVEGSASSLSSVFLIALMFWLTIVFFMFGILAPRNSLVYVVIFMASLSVASTLFVILDLDSPLSGLIRISSQPLRDALLHMDQPPLP